MPYKRVGELPDSVKDNLPHHAQEIYVTALPAKAESFSDYA